MWSGFDSGGSNASVTIRRAYSYYESLRVLFTKNFEEKWIWYASAWASTQAEGRQPIDGLKSVLLIDNALRNGTSIIRNDPKIVQLLKCEPLPITEENIFIFDLTDVLLGKTTRTAMSNDPRAGSPVPIDLWAYRDAGFVDRELFDYIKARFGAEQTKELKIDQQLGFDQYEWAAKHYRDLANELTKRRYLGLDWRPHQAQAVGRIAKQLSMEVRPILPEELFAEAGLRV